MNFFDIIEQFNIHDLIGYIKENPFYIVENCIINSILGLIMFWFLTPWKYGMYSFFINFFFWAVELQLKAKFSHDAFYSRCAFYYYGLSLYIFWANITGMVPESLTVTAFIELPAFLSCVFFLGSFFTALEQSKYKLPRGFLPQGVPVLVGPFLYTIEVISYFIRLFSLAIRLFINLLAGHMLLKIFSVIALYLFFSPLENVTMSFIINFVSLVFVLLEYIACMLQAIVLASLVAVYLDHGLNIYHH